MLLIYLALGKDLHLCFKVETEPDNAEETGPAAAAAEAGTRSTREVLYTAVQIR